MKAKDLKHLYSRSGIQPHEYLLLLSRGIQVDPIFDRLGDPVLDETGEIQVRISEYTNASGRAQAAVAAAPYYAPRLSAQAVIQRDPRTMDRSEIEAQLVQALGLKPADLQPEPDPDDIYS